MINEIFKINLKRKSFYEIVKMKINWNQESGAGGNVGQSSKTKSVSKLNISAARFRFFFSKISYFLEPLATFLEWQPCHSFAETLVLATLKLCYFLGYISKFGIKQV